MLQCVHRQVTYDVVNNLWLVLVLYYMLWFVLNQFMLMFDVMLRFVLKRLAAIQGITNRAINQSIKKTDFTVDLL